MKLPLDTNLTLSVITSLMMYLSLKTRAKEIFHRAGFILLMSVVASLYAQQLHVALQSDPFASWKTILQSHALFFGLLTYAATVPLALLYWRHIDRMAKSS